MRMNNVTVILPTKREEETIPVVLPFLRDNYNVIVVDDSDNDLTRQAVEKIGNCVFLQGVGNESPSIKHALETVVKDRTLPFETKYCVIVDCDGSQDFGIIPRMIEELKNGSDLMIGSRYVVGGSSGSSNPFSQAGNIFAKIVLGVETKDLTGRYVAAKPDVLLENCNWLGRGEACIELVFNAEKRGLIIGEVPFIYSARLGGKSKTSIPKYLWTYFWKVLGLKIESWKLYSKDYIYRGLHGQYVSGINYETKSSWLIDLIDSFQVPVYFLGFALSYLCGSFIIDWNRGVAGFFLRSCFWKRKLAYMGKDVFIDKGVTIFPFPEKVYIGEGSFLDTNVTIIAGGKLRVGRKVHIASNVLLNSKPYMIIGNLSCIGTGSCVYGSTNYYLNHEGKRTSFSSCADEDQQEIVQYGFEMGKSSFVGANSVCLPKARMGDYSVLGAGSLLNEEIPDYEIWAGSIAKKIK